MTAYPVSHGAWLVRLFVLLVVVVVAGWPLIGIYAIGCVGTIYGIEMLTALAVWADERTLKRDRELHEVFLIGAGVPARLLTTKHAQDGEPVRRKGW